MHKLSEFINKVHFGDCLETLKCMPDGVVNTCVTSPPYFGLRSYGGGDAEIGVEQRAPDYICRLVSVFNEVHRVLRDDGCVFVNLGDTYAGFKDGKFPAQSSANGDMRGLPVIAPHRSKKLLQLDGFKNKELMGIPWRFAFAMQDAGWYLRQELIWSKPNGTPEKVRDRFVKSHEHIFLFTKKDTYFFDGDAVRIPSDDGSTKLRGSVWTVPVSSYSGAHFATFPPELIEPCILAGAPAGGVVLDPFMGSGTTAQVSQDLGRQWIGCELNTAYAPLQNERIAQMGMAFLAAIG